MSRTAALSQYLDTLDEPSRYEVSKQNSNEGSSKENKPQSQPSEAVPSNSMASHKVVVTPSSLGMSVRDIVSSRNKLPDGRPRSRSAGRAPTRSSRDLVQDIYSRMGVEYSSGPATTRSRDAPLNERNNWSTEKSARSHAPQRSRSGEAPVQEQPQQHQQSLNEQQPSGTSSSGVNYADAFHERYRAAAALSTSSRGRGGETGAPERRSRSLGRPWHPGRSTQTAGEAPSTSTAFADVKPVSASELLQGSSTAQKKVPLSPTKNDRYGNASPSYPPWKKPSAVLSVNTSLAQEAQEKNEDKTECGESDEKEGELKGELPPPGSVKEKLSAYSGAAKGKNPRNFPKTYPSHYASKRDHPPKIDIYEEIRKAEEAENEHRSVGVVEQEIPTAPTSDFNKPSPAAVPEYRASGSSHVVSAYTPKSHPGGPMKSPSSPRKAAYAPSGVAGVFLAAINNPSTANSMPKKTYSSVPVPEVDAPLDALGATVDSTSVLSALSGDEFAQSPTFGRENGFTSKNSRPTWSERNKVASYQKMNSPTNGARNGQTNGANIKSAELEKLVDERVQAQVRVMQTRIQELESSLEERMKKHMEQMESKIDARTEEILSTIVNMLNGRNTRNSP